MAEIFKRPSGTKNPAALLLETTKPMMEIADLEEGAWRRLREVLAQA